MAKCQFIKSNKKQCQAMALAGQKYCFFHSVDNKVKKKSRGGLNNNNGTGSLINRDFSLKTTDEVMKLLEFTANGLLKGKISREKASCIGYLSNILLGAVKNNKFEERLEVIENVLNAGKQA